MAGRANIVLDRLVYYDNDTVVGEFILLPFNTVVIHNIAVEIQCQLKITHAKPTGAKKEASAILYSKVESLVKQNYHAQAGEKLIYSFGFHLPPGFPPTMSYYREVVKGLMGEYTGNVHWEVCVRADVEGVETLRLRKRFLKSTIYRLPLDVDNIGVIAENSLTVDDKELLLRASLGKCIYLKGEKIKVKLYLENNTSLPVTEIRCSCIVEITQFMAKKSFGAQARDIYTDSSSFQNDMPLAPGGRMETTVKVLPRNSKLLRHTSMVMVDEADWEKNNYDGNSAMLVPSYYHEAEDEAGKVRIEYFVRVSAILQKGRKTQKLTVELPFVLSEPKPTEFFVPDTCYVTPDSMLYTPHGDRMAVPMSDGPAPGSPAMLRRKTSKSMNYLRRLSRSTGDLLM